MKYIYNEIITIHVTINDNKLKINTNEVKIYDTKSVLSRIYVCVDNEAN